MNYGELISYATNFEVGAFHAKSTRLSTLLFFIQVCYE